jgi:cytochrome P450
MSQISHDDVVSPKLYADERRLHQMFAQLRAEAPIRWTEPQEYRPFWAITKYEDIVDIESRSDIFLAGPRNRLCTRQEEELVRAKVGGDSILRSLPTMDAPEHRKYRALFQQWFALPNLRKLEDRIGQMVEERLDHVQALDEPFDFVSEVSLKIPLQTILLIFGLPREDGDRLHRLSAQLFNPYDPDTARQTDGHGTAEAAGEMFEYFRHFLRERRKAPQDDLLTVIANAVIDEEPIQERDALSQAVSILVAGHDTTSSTLAGGVNALISHPECFAALQNGADVPLAVEEILRYVSPVRGFMRVATEDYAMRGQVIRKGDAVLLFYPSGNRDSDIFNDPDTFRLDRGKISHLTFGAGPHMCLGQMLARMELRAFFRSFSQRVAAAEFAAPTSWLESNFLGGPKRMPVRLRFR